MVSPKDYNCYEYVIACTEEYGEYHAVQHMGKRYTRSEIIRDADRFAMYMKKHLGLKEGDVYTIFMPTTVESIVAFYALNKIGVIVNFVHPLLPAEVLKETMDEVNPKGIMVLDVLAKKYTDIINEKNIPCLVCHIADYANIGAKIGFSAVNGLIKAVNPKIKNCEYYNDAVKMYPDSFIRPAKNADATAVYLNGGGTTGKSKTIKLTSRAINELVYRVSKLDRIHEPGEEAEIIVLPLFHCFGLCVAVHMSVCNAARIIPMMQFDAKKFNKLMMKNKIIGIVGIPVMFKKIMEEKHFDGEHLKNLRLAFCGGDDATDTLLDEFNSYLEKHGAVGRLRQGYGLTEVGSVCCTNTNTDYREGSIGKALDGVVVQIWDDNKRMLPPGEIGEIAISGPTVMSGYYTSEDTENDGLYIDSDGTKWVLSGDLGYKDEDDYIFFSGRKKRVIIISGYNVYPSDIEKKLSELPFVHEACAVKGFSVGKQIIRLYVSFCDKGNSEEHKQTIVKCCEDNFSKFSVPRDIVVVDELPQTPLMKIDFMKLTQNKPEDEIYCESKAN